MAQIAQAVVVSLTVQMVDFIAWHNAIGVKPGKPVRSIAASIYGNLSIAPTV
jgi:hypothetical protein